MTISRRKQVARSIVYSMLIAVIAHSESDEHLDGWCAWSEQYPEYAETGRILPAGVDPLGHFLFITVRGDASDFERGVSIFRWDGDLNGDGFPDVMLGHSGWMGVTGHQPMRIYMGTSDRRFRYVGSISDNHETWALEVAEGGDVEFSTARGRNPVTMTYWRLGAERMESYDIVGIYEEHLPYNERWRDRHARLIDWAHFGVWRVDVLATGKTMLP